MLTDRQRDIFKESLKEYHKKYMIDKFLTVDESGTRIMINNLLSEVLGYEELEEIRTEYAIKGVYADYVIQVEDKQHFVVEVKSIQIGINENHIRQATTYAANEGIEWIILTNGKRLLLYRVIFDKPLVTKLVFDLNLFEYDQLNDNLKYLEYLTKKCVTTGELEDFWHKHTALTPLNLSDHLYNDIVITSIRRSIKKSIGINFEDEDILEAIHKVVITAIKRDHPKK